MSDTPHNSSLPKPASRTFGVRLPEATIQRLSIRAIKEKRSVSDIVNESIALWWEAKGHLAKEGPIDAPEEA